MSLFLPEVGVVESIFKYEAGDEDDLSLNPGDLLEVKTV
jgi:hypothetical protein